MDRVPVVITGDAKLNNIFQPTSIAKVKLSHQLV